MADKIVVVPQHSLKPLKIVKWKVTEGNSVSIGCVLLLYKVEGENSKESAKLKSTKAGTVHRIVAQEGDVVKFSETLLELKACIHPTVMKDMCAECGADLRKDDLEMTASVPMIHSVPELKVSVELAQKLGKADSDRLLKDRKLVLLVDLDQTLIHTTNDNIPPNIKDVYHFQLYGPNSPWYHTRLRPGTHRFLTNIASLYELHICTFGARNYAHMIAMFLDQDGKLFSHRILSRDECFNSNSKTANLKALFPCGDNLVCIIDDREDVWSYATNLIHVKPYHFFQHTGDINAPPGLDKHEDDDKEGVDLTKVHTKVKVNGSNEHIECNEINKESATNMEKIDCKEENNTNLENFETEQNEIETKDVNNMEAGIENIEIKAIKIDRHLDNEEKISEIDEDITEEDKEAIENNETKAIKMDVQVDNQEIELCKTSTAVENNVKETNKEDTMIENKEAKAIKMDVQVENQEIELCKMNAMVEKEVKETSNDTVIEKNENKAIKMDIQAQNQEIEFCKTSTLVENDVKETNKEDTMIENIEAKAIKMNVQAENQEIELCKMNATVEKEVKETSKDTVIENKETNAIKMETQVENDEKKLCKMDTEVADEEKSIIEDKNSKKISDEEIIYDKCEKNIDEKQNENKTQLEMEVTQNDKQTEEIVEHKKPVDVEKSFENPEKNPPLNNGATENNTNEKSQIENLQINSEASKTEDLVEIEDPDDYLLYLEEILSLIHRAFYEKYDIMESGDVPDLKKVIPEVRGSVLKGMKLVFSGLVPTHIKLEQSKAYQVARSLGAVVSQDLQTDTTHLVAVRPGTAKVNVGRRKKSLKIVTPDWLWACAERWERVEEKLFPLNNKGSKNRHPPPHCSSPEHIPNFNVAEPRKRTPSGRFMDTINPLMSFSSADIADMDREVEDIFNESESESENKKAPDVEVKFKPKDSDDESSSSDESLTNDHPHGWNPESISRKRSREEQEQEVEDESTADEFPSTKFRRGEEIPSDLEFGQESNSEGSVDAPDEIDDGEWNMMGAALEREFLSNN